MGNSLCKSQPPNRSRNPFEELWAGCTNFCSCPSGISSPRNHHWKKQTINPQTPYLGSHTSATKWHQASTLTCNQPLRQNHPSCFDKAPVPPPRKKRTLQRSRSYEDVVDVKLVKKDGFKDVFGEPVALERQRTSASHNHIYHLDETESNKSGNSLKIGNKKSDKFFGENLSDSLSNERYSPEAAGILSATQKDELDMFVEKNVSKVDQDRNSDVEERLSDSLNKKAAFLMTMLDESPDKKKFPEPDDDDEERYRGMIPVEEEIIVPKRKITKCICDETDHLLHHLRHGECHKHTHKHEIEENPDELKKLIEKKDVATETPPIKPKRDLNLYRKSLDLEDEILKKDEKTSPEEEIPDVPMRRGKQVQNLMEQLVQHTLPHYMDIVEDNLHSCIDGSAAVSEKISKLKERKISKVSNSEQPTTPVVEEKVVLGCRDVTISPLHFNEERKSTSPVEVLTEKESVEKEKSPEKSLEKEKSPEKSPEREIIQEKVEKLVETEPKKVTEASPEPKSDPKPVEDEEKIRPEKKMSVRLQDDGVNQLEELIRHQQFNTTEDVINEIYKNQTNIVYEFQRFLEDELNKEENAAKLEKVKSTNDELLENQSLDLVSNSTASETSSEASTIKNLSDNESDIHPSNYKLRRESVDDLDKWFAQDSQFPNLADTHFDLVSTDSSSDNASTVRAISSSSEDEADQYPELLRNRHLKKTKELENRRESIEDVDNWFTQHLDVPNVNLSQSLVNEDAKKAEFSNYDGKLYPFGQPRERQMSLTDEFFAIEAAEEAKNRQKGVRRSNSESSYQ
ncbi:uncharacterized protein LOC134829981 [Culicoides brevitarsis]|uniref:uncharacterized protein LOC134829981 n=1 Tax=Culicoides brevitarsis TaxID=469753 RepID=UPI00307C2517